MRYLSEYRTPELINKYLSIVRQITTDNWNIMEVCGGQTHAIFKFGIDRLVPQNIDLLHGPGCPVCVTPMKLIDQATSLSLNTDTILCTFGDMMRVPGSHGDLLSARAEGADIRIVYSPLDAVALAQKTPEKNIVFFAIGFETTAPGNGYSVLVADRLEINNYSILCGMVRIPPAVNSLLGSPDCRIDALLAPGHVCTITGLEDYKKLVSLYQIPIIATGFEPADLVQGIYMAVEQLEAGHAGLKNQYGRAVNEDGNRHAQMIINEVFDVTDREWRGLGIIKESGYTLKNKYTKYDAEHYLNNYHEKPYSKSKCIMADILSGRAKPDQCPEFTSECRPEHPLGPMMVSSEGVCSAYYKYRSNYEK
ncbi:MAG: hydrogenase formation protein HypD [Candidatus Zixiibacteriota bacterium]